MTHTSELRNMESDENKQQLASSRRMSAVGGLLAAAMLTVVAWHVHGSRSPVALASTSKQASATNQLVRGAFQRAEGAEPVEYDEETSQLDEAAYVAGEQHVMNDVFKQQGVEDAAVKTAFYNAREKMARILEASIERQEEREKVAAVEAERRKHWVLPEQVDDEMKDLYSNIYHSHQLMYDFNALGQEVHKVEDKICDGHPCKHWHEMLDKTQAKAQDLEADLSNENKKHKEDLEQFRGRKRVVSMTKERVTKDIAREEKELKHWKDLATEYFDELHQTPPPAPPPPPPPPPPHCKGLVTLQGSSGSVDTGGPATDPEHNDCRWLIRSSSSAVVLHFPDVHVKGDEGRVSIFVGPENVALYKNEDVINWASAFKSFTGDAYPNPIVCPSNEVLVVFKTDAANAAKSKLKMTWGPASAAKVIAQESLAVLKDTAPVGSHELLAEKPSGVLHKAEAKPKDRVRVAQKPAVRKIVKKAETRPEKRLIGEEKKKAAARMVKWHAKEVKSEAEKRLAERKVVREKAAALNLRRKVKRAPEGKFVREKKLVRRTEIKKEGVTPLEKKAVAKEMRGKVRLGKKKMFLSAAEKAVKAKAAARLQSKAAAAVKKWG